MAGEEAAAMITVALGAVAEAGRQYPLERRQDAAARLLARAAACDGSAAAEALRTAAATLLREA
jgi:hypothetical protein